MFSNYFAKKARIWSTAEFNVMINNELHGGKSGHIIECLTDHDDVTGQSTSAVVATSV